MILRDYCVDWIMGWVACWIAFMSVFFTLEKLVFKSGSTPPRYLLDTFSSVKLLILFLIAIPTPFRHLVDRSSFCFWIWFLVARYLLNTSAIDDHFLNTYHDRFLDTCICRDLLRVYIYFLHDPFLISSISLNLSAPVHLPNTFSLTPNLFLCDFSSFFKILLLLEVSNLSFFMHFMFENLGFGIFWKFWDFSKLLSYFWNFEIGFHLNEFKTSYIASH